MHPHQSLIDTVGRATAYDATEQQHINAMLELLHQDAPIFDRTTFPAHVTGSAWLISPDYTHVLLTHHAILDKWLQFGGHADGDMNIANVALREAQEESGIADITFVSDTIFDIDVYPIPANPKRNEPAHFHYDIRCLLRSNTMDFAISSESKELKWFDADALATLDLQPSMRRMAQKWRTFFYATCIRIITRMYLS